MQACDVKFDSDASTSVSFNICLDIRVVAAQLRHCGTYSMLPIQSTMQALPQSRIRGVNEPLEHSHQDVFATVDAVPAQCARMCCVTTFISLDSCAKAVSSSCMVVVVLQK